VADGRGGAEGKVDGVAERSLQVADPVVGEIYLGGRRVGAG